jgi:hypothetical protein
MVEPSLSGRIKMESIEAHSYFRPISAWARTLILDRFDVIPRKKLSPPIWFINPGLLPGHHSRTSYFFQHPPAEQGGFSHRSSRPQHVRPAIGADAGFKNEVADNILSKFRLPQFRQEIGSFLP